MRLHFELREVSNVALKLFLKRDSDILGSTGRSEYWFPESQRRLCGRLHNLVILEILFEKQAV